jgi:flagellar protein FliO/FliZ
MIAVAIIIFLVIILLLTPTLSKKIRSRMITGISSQLTDSKFISAIPVGSQQKVVTIEVGPLHARSWLVLGVTSQNINCLQIIPLYSVNTQPKEGDICIEKNKLPTSSN